MWVVLVVKILNKEYESGRIHELRARVAMLPGDLHGLFRDIMTKDQRNMDDLLHCIQWILFSRERLDPQVLYFALLFKEAERGLNEVPPGAITEELRQRFILDTSKGLAEVVVDKSTQLSTVQFIHESVRDFFLKENGFSDLWPVVGQNPKGIGHEYLRKSCEAWIHVAWWFIPSYASSKCPATNYGYFSSAMIISSLPLLRHAVHNVLYHANEAQRAGIDQTEYLTSFSRGRWIWLANYLRNENYRLDARTNYRLYTRTATLLYILAERDLDTLIAIHPSNSSFLEIEQEYWKSPFLAAIHQHSCLAVQKFIELKTTDQQEVVYALRRHREGERADWQIEKYTAYIQERDFEGAARYTCDSWATRQRRTVSLSRHTV